MMKKCGYCGFENEEDAVFCGSCGKKLEDSNEVKEVKRPTIPPVVNQKTEEVEDLGFDFGEEPADEVYETEQEVQQAPKSKNSGKGIIVAAIIAGVAVIGAAGGGFMAYQNSKHNAEIAALKAEQQQKDKEAKKEAEAAKQEVEAAKKEAEQAKKDAEKARETTKTEKSDKSSSNDNKASEKEYPETGSYVANYVMKERDGASLNARQVDTIQKGQVLQIVSVIDSGDGAYWGKLSNGHYVCIKDNEYTYLS